jgi:uncharacterized protein
MSSRAFKIFDADLHHQYRSMASLDPYMPEGVSGPYFTRGSAIPNTGGAYRKDAVPPRGGVPGSDPEFVVEDHLDRYGIEYAILNPASLLGLGGMPDVDLAAALARATNDWTIQEWFGVDDRFLGSICVAPRDPDQAADEIRRLGPDPRFVQVTLTSLPCLMGNRAMYPIYEACNEFGLPVCLHVGGAEYGVNTGSFAAGFPGTFCEYHLGMCIPAIHHVVSMVDEGVFVRYPKMKLVMNEFGVSWLPFVMWRMDMEYRAARNDVPWLTRMPSEYIKEFVRFTTQPLEEPERPGDLATLLGLVGGEELMVFSSDYPHWDSDNPEWSMRFFPEDWREKVYWDNACKLYGLDERLPRIAERNARLAEVV